jgi:hypothetical protein
LITRITANCTSDGTMSGTISFTGPVGAEITVTLVVASHVGNKWDQTGGTTQVTATIGADGTATVNYSITVDKVDGANSYRTEVLSVDEVTGASEDVRGLTTKGPSLPCGGPATKASTLGTSLLAQLWLVATGRTE